MLRRVVLTRATLRNIPEDPILHSHRRENLKSYTVTLGYKEKSILCINGTSLINSISKGIYYGLQVYSWIKDICFFFIKS
jgi:hypothetical protein